MKITRRQFLAGSLTLAAAGLLAGCQIPAPEVTSPSSAEPEATNGETIPPESEIGVPGTEAPSEAEITTSNPSGFDMTNGRVLLNNGIEMPILGLGTFNLSVNQAETSVTNALNSGMRLIDTAAAYNNEQGVGRGIRNTSVPRDEIFVTTKLWPSNYSMRGIDAALQNLGVDYIDLLLLHQPSGDYIAGYQAMEQAVADGKVRAIGLSNFSTTQFDEVVAACSIMPAVHQVETHLHNQQADMQRYISQYGTLLEGWFPFGGRTNCQTFFNIPEVQEIAAGHGKSPAQTIIRWHLQSGHLTIPGSTNADHILENTQVFDFELTEEEMAVLNALNRNAAFFTGLGQTDEEARERMQQWADEWGLNIN